MTSGDGLLPPAAYAREDESADDEFYQLPRKVVHIDDGAIAALGRLYGEVLPAVRVKGKSEEVEVYKLA